MTPAALYYRGMIIVLLCVGAQIVPQKVEKTYGDVACVVVSIYDGDTFTADIPGWPPIIGNRISVRLDGIDTPERTSQDEKVRELAKFARMFAVEKLRAASVVTLRDIKRDKYFRIDATVMVDNNDLGKLLLDNRLAKSYDGGKKPGWSGADFDKYIANKK